MEDHGESSRRQRHGRRHSRRRQRIATPSPSRSPSPEPNPFDIHFPKPSMRERYENIFYARPVLVGKDYDWASLNEVYDFNSAFQATGLMPLFQFSKVIYADLVRIFYSNATTKDIIEDDSVFPWIETERSSPSTVTTFMFNTVIRITAESMNNFLHIPNGGARQDNNWDSRAAFFRICGTPVCEGESATDHVKHTHQVNLTPICRLIHHMVCYDISPKRNTNNLTMDDVFLIDSILMHRPLDVGYIIVRTFQRVLGRRDSHLAYTRLITALLGSYGFDLTGYAPTTVKSTFKKTDIQSKMHFSFDAQSNQYYRARAGGRGRGQQGEGGDAGIDVDINIEELCLPWHDEPMRESEQG